MQLMIIQIRKLLSFIRNNTEYLRRTINITWEILDMDFSNYINHTTQLVRQLIYARFSFIEKITTTTAKPTIS